MIALQVLYLFGNEPRGLSSRRGGHIIILAIVTDNNFFRPERKTSFVRKHFH